MHLAKSLRLEIFVKGQQVYNFGETTIGFFIVSRGIVDISKDNSNWNAVESTFPSESILPFGHFGSWSKKYKCRVDSAKAIKDSHLYRCSVEDLFELIERMSEMDGVKFIEDIVV